MSHKRQEPHRRGAAGTGVVLATRGEEVTLGKGTVLAASLASPLIVRVPAR